MPLTRRIIQFFLSFFLLTLLGCSTKNYSPKQKFEVQALHQDIEIIKQTLEEFHPSLYWYTPKDSIQLAFSKTFQRIDSAKTEIEFYRIIMPIIKKIRCGHTGLIYSKGYQKYAKTHPSKTLPIDLIVNNQRLYIYNNHSSDTLLRKGTEVLEINHRKTSDLLAELSNYITSDGYNQTCINNRLSSDFGKYFFRKYGATDSIKIALKDSLGNIQYKILKNSTMPVAKAKPTPKAKHPRFSKFGSFKFSDQDSSLAILDLNTFSGGGFRRFYHYTFSEIAKKPNIRNLVIDLRSNGGGLINANRELTRYIADTTFRVHSLGQVFSKAKPHTNHYLSMKFIRWATRTFARKQKTTEGWNYTRASVWASPKTNYNFNGTVFILTNGGTFSAASIFAANLKAMQPHKCIIIGRESGGGKNGCSAFFMPILTLPNSQLRIQIPMLRLLTNTSEPNIGRGIMPDIAVEYTPQAILQSKDLDMEKIYELLRNQ